MKHIYSFTAVFEDGTVIEQNCKEEDGDSSLNAAAKQIKPKGSRFTDVLYKSGQLETEDEFLKEEMRSQSSKLISFVIHNDQKSVGVDLRDGHFELNGVPFFQHSPQRQKYNNFRIIYYRTMRRVMSQTTGEEISADVLSYTVGWQTTENGKNIEKIVTI